VCQFSGLERLELFRETSFYANVAHNFAASLLRLQASLLDRRCLDALRQLRNLEQLFDDNFSFAHEVRRNFEMVLSIVPVHIYPRI
jgi:hypothetical protein